MRKKILSVLGTIVVISACSKSGDSSTPPPPPPEYFRFTGITVDGISGTNNYSYTSVKINPVIKLAFTVPVSLTSASSNISITDQNNAALQLQYAYASA